MRLSEAIRLGAMMKPQGRDHLLKDGHTCAIGAALEAIGQLGDGVTDGMVYQLWPFLQYMATHPTDGAQKLAIAIITNLNDWQGWTREAIADWVETIEHAQGIESGTNVVAVCPQDEPQTQPVRA